MKKIAFALSIIMMLSVVLCVIPSAYEVPEGGAAIFFEPFYGLDDNNGITNTNGEYDEYGDPVDLIGLKLMIDSEHVFNGYNIHWTYDSTKIKMYVNEDNGLAAVSADDYLLIDESLALGATPTSNPGKAYDGDIWFSSVVYAQATNFSYKEGRVNKDFLNGVIVYAYFEPLTDEPCDVTINFVNDDLSYLDEEKNSLRVEPRVAESFTIHLNGGAPAVDDEPVKSLGAKVNTDKVALRFGATYNKIAENGAVANLGMILAPEAKCGGLSLVEYAAVEGNVAISVSAKGIVEYVAGQAFDDYSTFTYYVTVVGLDGHEDDVISAVPFIEYEDGTIVYADQLDRSYSEVLAEAEATPAE